MSRLDDLYTSAKDNLTDISDLHVDTSLPPMERLNCIIDKINPYRFKCGEILVEAKYSDTKETLNEIITDFFVNFNKLK